MEEISLAPVNCSYFYNVYNKLSGDNHSNMLFQLGSRSQDLIPRVILCISKLSQSSACYQDTERKVITTRAMDLINLLKLPKYAPFKMQYVLI